MGGAEMVSEVISFLGGFRPDSSGGRTRTAFVVTMLLASLGSGQVRAQVGLAIPGEPFGVVHVPLGAGAPDDSVHQVSGYRITTPDGEVLYPVVSGGRVLEALGATSGKAPTQLFFLFRGRPPTEVTVHGPVPRKYGLRVIANDRQYRRVLNRWWREYQAVADREYEHQLVPAAAASYFREMLAARIQPAERIARIRDKVKKQEQSEAWNALEFLLGVERLRAKTIANLWDTPLEVQDQSLPHMPAWTDVGPDHVVDVAVEPLATRTPEQCFYIRFGTFSNYLWFQRLLDEYGGDLAAMVTLRSTDEAASKRLQDQLGLQQSALADLVGDRVISDVALIGYDLYTADGAAMGVLFHARNNLLGIDLQKQRRAALARSADEGGKEETFLVGDTEVSCVSTPDNRLRSFYAHDGAFHLVTNCRRLIEEFLLPAEKRRSLAGLAQFRHARLHHPFDSDDTLFAFFSSPFFQNITSPHYQVELSRRFRSQASIQTLILAKHVAQREGIERSVQEMLRANLLPPLFADSQVAAQFAVQGDGYVDRLRGPRGTYLPIPDTPVERVTATESGQVAARNRFFVEHWRQFDPLMVAAKRHRLADARDVERVSLLIQASPFDEQKLHKYTSLLAPPTAQRIAPSPGDVVFLQAAVQGGTMAPQLGTHHVLFGLQDSATAWPMPPETLWDTLQLVRSTPAYIASWPRLGLLDQFPIRLHSAPDAMGYMRLPFGLWRLDRELFTAIGFHPELLGWVANHLKVVDGQQLAQVRLHVGDLSQSSLRPFIDGLQYRRAWLSSIGGARWMNYLGQQLSLPPDRARAVAEQLGGSSPICPLGGDYVVTGSGATSHWTSTALTDDAAGRFQAPVLQWFRGLSADLLHDQGKLRIRAELDIHRRQAEGVLGLPLFDFLRTPRPDVVLPPKKDGVPKAEEVPLGPVDFEECS